MDLAELDAGFDPNPPKQNEGVSASFYYHTGRDDEASREQGRPIFKDHVYIRATVAGDRSSIIERPATEMDKRRYAAHYKNFLANNEQVTTGFPLAEWPGITRSQVEELKYFQIRTVEDLAAVSDANGQKFPMFITLRNKAKEYLAALEKNAPLEKIQAELKERDDKIALLEQNMAALMEEAKKKSK